MEHTFPTGSITRVTAWLALSIEVFDFAADPLGISISPSLHGGLEKLGILLFLVSLVSWLEASNEGLAKLDKMALELQHLTEEANKIDLVARYGASAACLARLMNPQGTDIDKYPHCRAGGATLSHLLLTTYTQAAEEFHRLRSGDAREVRLTEASIINLFLKNLVESLPPGSVWLGTSTLQESGAWEESTAEPSYYDFERAVETRIEQEALTYLRVLCFQNTERYQQMSRVAKHQMDQGLHVRSLIRKDLPNDLSLIWIPKAKSAAKFDLADPVRFLERQTSQFEPLCGLSFGIRADREVYTMDLVDPRKDEFTDLKKLFIRSWAAAKLVDPADVASFVSASH